MLINQNEIELPSNRKFGIFFSIIFIVIAIYFYLNNNLFIATIFICLSTLFFFLALFKDTLLLPLNKFWIYIGIVLGKIVSPVVMGIIFLLIFTPVGIFMRLFKRDELLLKSPTKKSYWRKRESKELNPQSFKQQF